MRINIVHAVRGTATAARYGMEKVSAKALYARGGRSVCVWVSLIWFAIQHHVVPQHYQTPLLHHSLLHLRSALLFQD